MDIVNRSLPIVLSILMSVNLSGCGSEEQNSREVDDVYAATVESTDPITAETADATEKKKSETTDGSVDDDVNLPPDMTFDDLHNMIKLNGQTISLPTTFNELLAIDDNFSYEWNNAEKQFKTPEEQLDNGLGVSFDLLYNDVFVTTVMIQPWTYNGNLLDSKVLSMFTFFEENCKKADLKILIADKLDFNSTKQDVIAIFGNNYSEDQFKNSDGIDVIVLNYFFYDGDRELPLEIYINKDDLCVRGVNYGY